MASQEPAESPRWPERIPELARDWSCLHDSAHRERALAELWTLINIALQKYALVCALRLGPLDPEDIRDLAADKALDILSRIESRSWDPAGSTPAEICGFLAGVARHGVIDKLRARSRELRWLRDPAGPAAVPPACREADAEGSAEHAEAILECSRRLTPKARQVWFLRVFYDLPSSEIARHPDVTSTPAAVDATLLRCRKLMRACMQVRGFDPGRIPTGTFTMLWEVLVKERKTATR
ncbi:MAG: RNA polymerase sigma factor [Candidatus Polarisedimenticolia bacterium]